MDLTRYDMQFFAQYVEKLKPLPWRIYLIILAASFTAASLLSTIVGYVIVSVHQKIPVNSSRAMGEEVYHFPDQAPTLTEQGLKKILERNIFNSENEQEDPNSLQRNGPSDEISRTTLPIKLVGLIYGGDATSGLAMVENTSKPGTVNSFLVGDVIAPDQGATVKEILRDRILISVQDRVEYASLDEQEIRRSSRRRTKSSSGPASSSLAGSDSFATDAPPESFKEDGFVRGGGNIEMTSAYKQRLLGPDFANVLQDAKASPNMTPEGVKGFRLDRIRKNSIYEKAGLMNSDVVEEINGVPLTDAGQAIKLMQSLVNESEVEIRINRSGTKQTLNMKVK